MEAHRDHADVQERGCGALAYLARKNHANKVSIVEAGGIATIVSGVKAHGDQAGVQEERCRALSNLAAKHKWNQVLIVNVESMIATIVSGMEAHRDHAGTQQQGLRVLAVLADRHFDNRINSIIKISVKEGGIAAIVSGMETHRDHADAQRLGCMALVFLAQNPDNHVPIAKAGGGYCHHYEWHGSAPRPRWCTRGWMRGIRQSCWKCRTSNIDCQGRRHCRHFQLYGSSP